MNSIQANNGVFIDEYRKARETFFSPSIAISKSESLERLRIYAPHICVLCVDDDRDVRSNLQTALSRFPFIRVDFAENGKRAIEMFKRQKHEVVLTDFDMPEMDGITLSNEIFATDPEIIVMVLSSFSVQNFVMRLHGRNPYSNIIASPKLKDTRIVKKSVSDSEFWNRFSRSCGYAVMNKMFAEVQKSLAVMRKGD